MNIDIIACGLLKDAATQSLIDTYLKRMTRWPVKIVEFSENHSKKSTSQQIKAKEAEHFKKYIKPDSYIIALDERGKQPDSMKFSQIITSISDNPDYKSIQFLIGGAYGLCPSLLSQAHQKIAFGALTWPHMMVRLMITEQIYRAQQIANGHPYHK